jgi:predicted nucleic acid-binding protein
MSGKYLLDTNIVIALFAEDPSVQKHIASGLSGTSLKL